ncbi:uncharacterized protein LOC127352269 [Dicentrarchus labrax]|uniref:uncharacterized protein LOC127352269 n=1 Tax=Dicentrarchus labrax TaxID=13489 RepID=UPI0021F56C01|nr:uncharacterized protein LOC127352269 [Dicentrarchus labrax]
MSEGLISDDQSRGLQSSSGASTEDQCADTPYQPKFSSGPAFLNLSRCSACYRRTNQWVDHGESSSSAEDSGPEEDLESEAESSSSSSCSPKALSEILEEPESEKSFPGAGDAAEPESGERDGDGPEEKGETLESEEDKSRTKGMTRRAPLVKSFSLPATLTPHLIPLSLLPRPHRVVSTLNLEVLSQNDDEAFYIIKQHLSEGEEKKKEINTRGGNNLMPPQIGLPWQHRSLPTLQQHQLSYQYQQQPHQQSYQYQQQPHQLLHQHQHQQQPHQQSYQYQQQPHQQSYQYQQQPHQQSYQYQQQPHQLQQPQRFPPLSAQDQRLPPPLHTLPVLHPSAHHAPLQVPISPQTHLHALTPQTCWYCYSMNFPYSP